MTDRRLVHEPVLVEAVLETMKPGPGMTVVDCTLGHAGHALQFLARIGDEGLLIGVDRDIQMLEAARTRIEAAHIPGSRYLLVEADHADLLTVLDRVPNPERPVAAPDLVLFDLGPSTPQLLDPTRGMSWESDAPLDMRMRRTAEYPTAAEIVNSWPEAELAKIFKEYADERWAKRIAQRIAERRALAPIQTGRELGDLVCGAIPRAAWPPRTHPATRVFLALRIEVNGEYRIVERILPAVFERLKPGGRLGVISFHGGEHRIVREFMRRTSTAPQPPWPLPNKWSDAAPGRMVTKKAIGPTEDEVRRNPRSRSAQLRVIQKAN
jgi:16S rRNA (cytosine1402-N4)-methyltransferase